MEHCAPLPRCPVARAVSGHRGGERDHNDIMTARAIWKGHLELGQLVCAVALYAAASTSERIAFHVVNARTGHRVRRAYFDSETGKPVDREDQVKAYETETGKTVTFRSEELSDVVPESDKRLSLEAFVGCDEVDTLYFDRPYYLAPADDDAVPAYAVIRDGLARRKVAAIARTVLFRRVRAVLIRAEGPGLVASTLEFDHEVRDAAKAFEGLPDPKLDDEMIELAEHIIASKRGKFDPAAFEDRYDDALAALVKAKAEGRELPKPRAREPEAPVDLLEALRLSAREKAKRKPAGKKAAVKPTPNRRTG